VQSFTCSKCQQAKPRAAFHEANARDRKREVTSQCRECRSEVYFEKRYPDSVCAQCLKHRPLDRNKICASCNEEAALRQCRQCTELLPVLLEFYGSRKTCKRCSKSLRARRDGGEPTS